MPREDVLREGPKDVHQVKKCVVIGRVCTTCHQKESASVRFENKKHCGQLLLIRPTRDEVTEHWMRRRNEELHGLFFFI